MMAAGVILQVLVLYNIDPKLFQAKTLVIYSKIYEIFVPETSF